MFSSMTADAAAQHGHEFSAVRPPAENRSAASTPRSALSAVLSIVTTPRFPTFGFGTPKESKDDESSLFKALDTADAQSDDVEPSRPSSAGTEACSNRIFQPKSPRSKTTFRFAHPPRTKKRQKLHVRPKVLLQMHRVNPGAHAKPEFEVIPSMRCAPRIIRKFNRVFTAMEKLGPDDVVVTRADSYGSMEDNVSNDEEIHEAGEPVAVICTSRSEDGKDIVSTDICMDDGTVWQALPLPNGSYEFTTKDSHGVESKTKWVLKAPNRRVSTHYGGGTPTVSNLGAEDRRFNFSTIRNNSRRHPVIANMTAARLEVQDEYAMPDSPTTLLIDEKDELAGNRSRSNSTVALTQTTEQLRKFIVASGIWVSFREQWSSAFQYSTNSVGVSSPIIGPSDNNGARPYSLRTTSLSSVEMREATSTTPVESPGGFPRILRSGSNLLNRSTTSAPGLQPSPRLPASPAIAQARRTNSIGTAYIQRANSKKLHRSSLHHDLIESKPEQENQPDAMSSEQEMKEDMIKRASLPPRPKRLSQLGVDGLHTDEIPTLKKRGSVHWVRGLLKRSGK